MWRITSSAKQGISEKDFHCLFMSRMRLHKGPSVLTVVHGRYHGEVLCSAYLVVVFIIHLLENFVEFRMLFLVLRRFSFSTDAE